MRRCLKTISVEVAYALPDQQWVRELRLTIGVTAREAIDISGVLIHFPEIDLSHQLVGIFGTIVPLEHELKEGDRVEVYRPLMVDPKSARRLRAASVKDTRAQKK